MKNIVDLRNEAIEAFMDLKKKNIDPKQAKEMNNGLNTIMKSCKLQLENAKARKEQPDIEFLNSK